MSTFLFWNTGRRPIVDLISTAARAFEVDVLMLAECPIPGVELLSALNRTSADYQLTFTVSESVKVLTRFHAEFLRPTAESDRYSVRRLRLPGQQELLIVIAHLPSGLFFGPDSRSLECVELSRLIIEEEQKAGHDRTLLVGDLNLNPFEHGVVAANGLHAVMTRRLAARGSRTVQQRKYPIFYNPMWRFFGDRAPRPSGTYYYERAEHVVYFWNIFDQILVRPSLVDGFEDGELRIVDAVGHVSLTHADGRPNSAVGSDHLPILFAVNIPLEDTDAERIAEPMA
jgi:endonuclease/exonuclease/phosphatase family metal-dependent hydrolase